MMRSSQQLAALRDAMLNHALIGGSISAVITTDICQLLDVIVAQCEQMETRLAGDLPANGKFEGDNITSLVVHTVLLRDRQPRDTP